MGIREIKVINGFRRFTRCRPTKQQIKELIRLANAPESKGRWASAIGKEYAESLGFKPRRKTIWNY